MKTEERKELSPTGREKDKNLIKDSVSMKERTTIELDRDFVEYCKWHIDAFGAHEGKTVQDLIVEAIQDQVNLERSTGNGMETLIFEERLKNNSCVEAGAIPLSEFMDRIREKPAEDAREQHKETETCLECGEPVPHGHEFCSWECEETYENKARPMVVRRAGFTATVVFNGIEKIGLPARKAIIDHLHNACSDFECLMAEDKLFDLQPVPQAFMQKGD